MPRFRLLAVLLLLGLASAATVTCGAPDQAARIARVENGLRSPVVIKGDPTWNIVERMKHYKVPGVSIAVFDGRRVLWAKGYGVMDADTREPVTDRTLFVAGSISKPVAAMGALKLVDEGKIGLDRNINDVLTSWKLPENELTAGHPVTLRELLSHSGGTTVHGFGGYAEGQAVPSVTDVLDGKGNSPAVRVDVEPGKQWRYSGGGVTVMQLALMDVEKASFPEILRREVLDPIGMTSSSYEQTFTPERLKLAASGHKADGQVIPGQRHAYPEMAAAGLWTTPTDLAKFAMEVRHEARGESRKVLSKETAGLMLKPQIAIAPGQDMALGLFLEDRGGEVYYGHGGQDEGFIAQLIADRESGCGAAVMTNSDGPADALIGEILQSVAAEYGWKNYVPAPLDRATLSPEALEGFSGRYRLDSDTVLAVSCRESNLFVQWTDGGEFELVPVGAAEFARREAPIRYVFDAGEAGGPAGLTILRPGNRRRLTRMGEGEFAPIELLRERRLDDAAAAYRALWDKDPKDPVFEEGRINTLGYDFLRNGQAAAAVVLFELNVAHFPMSWNVHDSLGEGYAALGRKAEAIKSYERSLELNPQSAGGRAALEKLKEKPPTK